MSQSLPDTIPLPVPPARLQKPLDCWGIADGAAGHGSQIRGLCSSLTERFETFDCRLRLPWRALPSPLVVRSPLSFQSWGLNRPDLPHVVISCGRQAATASIVLRHFRPVDYAIHLQHPQASLQHFDLIVVPEHDSVKGNNVISSKGALHPLSPAILKETAAEGPVAGLEKLGSTFVAVLLGGPNRCFPFNEADVEGLLGRLKRVRAEGHRLAVLPSRRTPDHAIAAFRQAFGESEFVWDGISENPYRSALALASHVVVTGDSVSMISEATATGRPVYVEFLSARRSPAKFLRFHESFLNHGLIRPFVGRTEEWSYPPLFEADRVSQLVRDRIEHRAAVRGMRRSLRAA